MNLDAIPMMNFSSPSMLTYEKHHEHGGVRPDELQLCCEPEETTIGDFSRLLRILESAEDVLEMDTSPSPQDIFHFEPTPLRPDVVWNVVDPAFEYPSTQVGAHSNSLYGMMCNPKRPIDVVSPESQPLKKQRLKKSSATERKIRLSSSSVKKSNRDLDTEPDEVSSSSKRPATNVAMRFRQYQADQWEERFGELKDFKHEHGHCLVPHNYPANQHLAQWTKRQRYQYKLKNLGRHSTLTDKRQEELEDMGFIWDSHGAAWHERFESLKDFMQVHEHTNVPSNYEADKPLAVWVKCREYGVFLRLL